MKKIIDTFKNFIQKILNLIPTKIPVGVTEFEKWASSIIKTYGFPDNDSVRWALAVKVLHMGETEAYKAKHYFFLALHKAMANQIVSHVIQELKTKQTVAASAPVTQEATPTSADSCVSKPSN